MLFFVSSQSNSIFFLPLRVCHRLKHCVCFQALSTDSIKTDDKVIFPRLGSALFFSSSTTEAGTQLSNEFLFTCLTLHVRTSALQPKRSSLLHVSSDIIPNCCHGSIASPSFWISCLTAQFYNVAQVKGTAPFFLQAAFFLPSSICFIFSACSSFSRTLVYWHNKDMNGP